MTSTMRAVLTAFALAMGLVAGKWFFQPPAQAEQAQDSRPVPTAPAAAPVAEPQTPPAPAGFALSPATFSLGAALEGEMKSCTLKIDRPAGTALTLGRLYATCPCVTVTSEKLRFVANEPASISVSIHSLKLEGIKSFPISVELLEPTKGTLKAEVSIDVKRVPAKITLVPEAIHFGAVRGAKKESVKLLNLTDRPITLSTPTCSVAAIKVSAAGSVVAPGQAMELTAEAQADMPAGPIQGVVMLGTSCPEHFQMTIPMDGTVVR